jgi:acetolactate synthase small subunit
LHGVKRFLPLYAHHLRNEQVLEQIKKQLNKLVNVIKVVDFVGKDFVEREMILIKVKAKKNKCQTCKICNPRRIPSFA